MAKHTPGPWHATPLRHVTRIIDIGAANGANVAEVYTEKDGGQPEDEAQANAALIASAPDLLAELEGLLERYTQLVNCGDCGHWDPEQEPQVVAARAAIAKATGG